MLGVEGLNYNVGPLRIVSAIEIYLVMNLDNFFNHIKIAFCPWSMTFITCFSKNRWCI